MNYGAITLRFFGDNLDPEVVTRMVGIEPSAVDRIGEPRRIGSGTYPTTSWRFNFTDVDEVSPDNLNRAMLSLPLDAIRSATSSSEPGIENADLFCQVWVADTGGGPYLGPRLMRAFADAGLTLNFDVYVDGD